MSAASPVQGGLVDGPGLQPAIHYVVHPPDALQGFAHGTQQPALARRGEDEHLAELERIVPRVRFLLGRAHLHQYRVHPDPRERGGEEDERERDEDHKRGYPYGRRRDGEEDPKDYERDGEAQGNL